MDTVRGGEGGMNGESSTDEYTLACGKQTTGGELLCAAGNPAWHSVMTQRGRMEGGEAGFKGKSRM